MHDLEKLVKTDSGLVASKVSNSNQCKLENLFGG
nr:MAG TPA_asm: hypothetical protein [Bacteriophage sp.]DAP05630.1 MAG TPA: hypothetical protein [Caudoviricetes sp.]